MKNLYFIAPIVLLIMILFTACSGNGTGSRQEDGNIKKDSVNHIANVTVTVKPIINVYIENSGSMDGYVNVDSDADFKSIVYNYLSNIKISKIADSLNLYYVNSELIPQGTVSEGMDVLKDFIEKLNPTTFKIKGGNRATSDIADVLKSVLQKTNKNTISILVTDGIFSPGKGKNAQQYLVSQEIGIKDSFATFLSKVTNGAVIVYQLSSNFNGFYYNKVDAKKQIHEQRPYYMWIIGDAKQLSDLRKNVPDSKFINNGVQNVFTVIAGNQLIKYAIIPSSGKFRLSRIDNHTIEDLEKDSRTGKVKFAVNTDFSNLLFDNNYLLDTKNYDNTSKYNLDIKQDPVLNSNYSHIFTFTSDKVSQGTVSVKLKAKLSAWIETANDNDGTTAAKGKTYGIKYQIEGVFDAFTFNNDYYTEIKINIK